MLLSEHPVAIQYHEKNEINVNMMTSRSNKKVWWYHQDCGHEWKEVINNRTGKNNMNCPVCHNRILLAGFNDLATKLPHLIEEWDHEINDITPSEIKFNDKKYVIQWKCKDKGHTWKETVNKRSTRNKGCIQCASLANNFPELLEEWDYNKNTINPEEIKHGSVKKVWWKSSDCGHEWEQTIRSRTRDNHKCPYCSNQLILEGYNDLATIRPDLAKQWSANNTKKATEVGINNKTKFLWTNYCKNNHEWKMSPYHRAKLKDLSCMKCVSIVYTHTEIAKQYHDKNTIDIYTLKHGSSKKVWWKSNDCGHEWEQTVISRILNNLQCQVCANQIVVIGFNDFPTTAKDVYAEWCHEKNTIDPHSITKGSSVKAWWICSQNSEHEWYSNVSDRVRGSGCPYCSNSKTTSKGEEEIGEFLRSYGIEYVQNIRSIIRPKELDIYIPDKSIAIEFNGLYWHTESHGKDKYYHYNKWKECKDKGIQLLTIWEDDWRDRQSIVKSMILHKLGISSKERVYARKTIAKEISREEAQDFCDTHHIQSGAIGSAYLGLFYNDELVAVMIFKKRSDSDFELSRYATSTTVVGGFTKLLSFFEKTYLHIEKIITFADHCVSDGALYENHDFVALKELKPDYSYLVNNTRNHKFNFRIKNFRNSSDLLYEEGLTERELAQLNNLHRVYDCGKTKYVKER